MNLKRCLVLSDCGFGGAAPDLNVIRSLGKRGVQVIYAHCNRTPTIKSKYIQKHIEIPPPDSNDFIPAVLNIVKDFGCQVVIPVNDGVASEVSKHKREFEEVNATVPVPDWEVFDVCRDKYKTIELAKKAGVAYPKTFIAENIDELQDLCKQMNYEVVLKTRSNERIDGKNSKIFMDSPDSLNKLVKEIKIPLDRIMIQEQIRGGFGTVYTVSAVLDGNDVLAKVVCRKIHETVLRGSVAVFAETVENEKVENAGLKLLTSLNWYGVASPELKVDPKGVPVLMEINPRFFGYTKLAIDAGVDLPWIVYRLACGEKIRTDTYTIGMRFSRFLSHINCLTSRYPRLIPQAAYLYLTSIGRIGFDKISLSDSKPWLDEWARYVGSLLKTPLNRIRRRFFR